jgi:glycosyltransferase involved in cell wall biosynthesis
MKIISLGLDKNALDSQSLLAARLRDYGLITEKYVVFVPGELDRVVDLSDKVRVYSIAGKNKATQLLRLLWRVYGLMRVERFSLVTVQDPYYLGFGGLLLGWYFGLKLEIQIHGFEKGTWLRMIVARIVIKRADGVRVVSERLKKMLIKDYGLDTNRINVVPVYTPLHIADRDYSLWPHKPFIFLTVSRLVPIKNIRLQIEAVTALKQDGFACQLWIVGDGPERDGLIEFSRQCGISDAISFLGYQPQVRQYYEKADAFLLTSNAEGWGLVILEAAAAGLPIIMTDVGCAGEIIIDNQSGRIIPVADKQALIVTMKQIMTDKDLALRLGRGAQQVAVNQSRYQDHIALYMSFWKKLL